MEGCFPNNNMTKEKKYPHFIQSKPCGIDKFEGQSHRRLTEAIANHIISNDNDGDTSSVSRIIGLEGGWGVGKSNIIKQLKEVLKEDYYLFEYDTWGHQEDLQRRSFLELITDNLINEAKILDKNEWEEKLNDLLARKIVTVNKTFPKLNPGALFTAIFLSLTPITVFISERLEASNEISCIWHLILIAFSPIIIGILLWLVFMIKNKDMRSISYLLQISKDGNIETKNYETINEDEPTVVKFKKWMRDISDHIKKNQKQKLIVVFDNMDRLPADKVKEVWSSIHTFFSEDGFDNIWAIIPFDEKHLSCAFGEIDNNIQLTKYFINKTFPIVYRVTPPVITDFKEIFSTLYEEAFSKTEYESHEIINRIFRLENPTATIRDVIIFVNQLVALKTIWCEEIDLLSIAIFILKKDELLEDAVSQILSGDYLGNKISKILQNDEILQRNISALTYGILPNDAEQIPISKYIERCLMSESGYDINKYSSHKHFLSVLKDKVLDADIPPDDLIKGLAALENKFEEGNKEAVVTLWNDIAQKKIQIPLIKLEFDETFKTLLTHIDSKYQQDIVNFLCYNFQTHKEFHGKLYYHATNNLRTFFKKISAENDINNFIVDIEKSPEIFIDYVSVAKENYTTYKLRANPEKLDEYLANLIPAKLEGIGILDYLVKDKLYNFDKTLKKIEDIIKNDTQLQILNADNFKIVLDTYKILTDKKPLPVQLNSNQCSIIWNSLVSKPNTKEFQEILLIQSVHGVNCGIVFNEDQLKIVSENTDYYACYGDLLLINLSWNIAALNQVLKYMTENKLGQSMTIENVLPKYFEIKSKIDVTEVVLIEQLDRWNESLTTINRSNIQSIIPNALFFKFSTTIKNTLTNYLNKTIIEALSDVSVDLLYQQRTNLASYWYVVIANLLETEFLEPLPDNLTEVGKKLLNDIASGNQSVPNKTDLFAKLITKINKKETGSLIKDIRDAFCNSRYMINPQLFVYFEAWFDQQGDLLLRSHDVVHKILEPVISNNDCLNIMISKTDYYTEIINKAGDDATGIIKKINEIIKTNKDDRLIKFADKIKQE